MSNGKGGPHTPVSDKKSVEEHAKIKKAQDDYQKGLHLANDGSQNIYGGEGDESVSTTTTSGGSSKKPGGTVSYHDAYEKLDDAKKSSMTEEQFTKKAKDWNLKKYKTENPTAAAKDKGITKDELAEANKPIEVKPRSIAPKAISTANNTKIQRVVDAVNAPDSLINGVKTRRETRQANRQTNKDNREANRIRHAGQKAGTQKVKKQERQDARQKKGDKRFERKTGINMSGTPSYSPELDTGAGTYQGAQKAEAKKKANWRPNMKSILGSERS